MDKPQAKRITDLPEEVLLGIFDYLNDKSDIYNTTLTCKSWNQIIARSQRILNKLNLHIECTPQLSIDHKTITRNYRKIRITQKLPADDNCNKIQVSDKVHEVLERFKWPLCDHLTTLELVGIEVKVKTMRIVSQYQLIKNLSFLKCPCKVAESQFIQIELKNLKQLNLIKSSTQILKFLETKKFDHISLLNYEGEIDTINNFLNQLDQCDSLKLTMECKNMRNSKQILSPTFKWLKLDLEIKDLRNITELQSMNVQSLFHATAQHSVAHLKLENWFMSIGTLNQVVSSCTNMKSLSLAVNTCWFDATHHATTTLPRLQTMTGIERLEIDFSHLKEEQLDEIMRTIPDNVKQLSIGKIEKVKNLRENQRFISLLNRIVHLDISRDLHGVLYLSESHFVLPILETLTIDLAYFRELEFLYIMLQRVCERNLRLKHLNVKVSLEWMVHGRGDELEVILSFLPELKLLKLFSDTRGYGVKTCNIQLIRHKSPHSIEGPRDEREAKMFGRSLTEDERRFFTVL